MINLPNISGQTCGQSSCPDPDAAIDNSAQLILKPELLTVCAVGSIQFSAFVRNSMGEVLLTSGLQFLSSNPSAVSIDQTSGKATLLGGGVVTISVGWQGQTAYAQLNIIGGTNCCDDIKVASVLLVDCSISAGQIFNDAYSTRLSVAKKLSLDYVSQLQAKDADAIIAFGQVANVVQPLTNVIADLDSAINGITLDSVPPLTADTDVVSAINLAISTLDGCNDCDRKVIVILSDGNNRPPLTNDQIAAVLNTADSFKAAGGIIVCVGLRASGDGYQLLQQIASGGFFINAYGDGSAVVTAASALLVCVMGFYCAGPAPVTGYGSPCEHPGAQNPDPHPTTDNELASVEPVFPRLPAINFSPFSGTAINNGLKVFLVVPGHPNAKIRFTTDGTTPTFAQGSGKDYSGQNAPIPLPAGADVTIKAIARESGWLDSPVATATFVAGSGTPPFDCLPGQPTAIRIKGFSSLPAMVCSGCGARTLATNDWKGNFIRTGGACAFDMPQDFMMWQGKQIDFAFVALQGGYWDMGMKCGGNWIWYGRKTVGDGPLGVYTYNSANSSCSANVPPTIEIELDSL